MEKNQIRSEIRKKKRQLSEKEIQDYSAMIANKLYALESFQKTECMYCYVSYNQEVDTKKIISYSLSLGKRVAVPKVIGKQMLFFFITDLKELSVGYQGILEPISKITADGTNGIMIMPGLAFDMNFHRIGYGGGFYDKYLEVYEENIQEKIAFGYDFQVVESVQTELFDKTVDCILTPNYMFQKEKSEDF